MDYPDEFEMVPSATKIDDEASESSAPKNRQTSVRERSITAQLFRNSQTTQINDHGVSLRRSHPRGVLLVANLSRMEKMSGKDNQKRHGRGICRNFVNDLFGFRRRIDRLEGGLRLAGAIKGVANMHPKTAASLQRHHGTTAEATQRIDASGLD